MQEGGEPLNLTPKRIKRFRHPVSLLHLAVCLGHTRTVEELIKLGAKVSYEDDPHGEINPIHCAILSNRIDIVRYLSLSLNLLSLFLLILLQKNVHQQWGNSTTIICLHCC